MAKEFKVPELGEGVESASVAKVLVSEGDKVEQEQAVIELETDKAVTEVPCDIAGTVEAVKVKEGDEVKVGQVILTLKDEGEGDGKGEEEKSEPDDGQGDAGQDDEKKSGAKPDKKESGEKDKSSRSDKKEPESDADEGPAEEENDEGEAEEAKDGGKAEGEKDGGEADSQVKKRAKKEEKEEKQEDKSERSSGGEPAPAAPSVRRFAREIGVDIDAVEGSGPHGRISEKDVKEHARSSGRAGGDGKVSAELPDFSQWGSTERKPMSKVRRLTAESMSRAWALAPQATQFGKADVTEVEKLRQRFKKDAEEAGGHLSLTVIIIKAVAGALKAFPRFNASVDAAGNEIVYKQYCHIGLAMDTERGLLVPVIRDADCMNVIELSVAMKDLTTRARDGKLKAEEMHGGSLTITNAGALGGDTFIPIVNWPEVAILGVARTRIEPVFEDGVFQPRTLLPLSLSYDHRIIDGADGVRFMQWLVDAIEDPVKMAWEG